MFKHVHVRYEMRVLVQFCESVCVEIECHGGVVALVDLGAVHGEEIAPRLGGEVVVVVCILAQRLVLMRLGSV